MEIVNDRSNEKYRDIEKKKTEQQPYENNYPMYFIKFYSVLLLLLFFLLLLLIFILFPFYFFGFFFFVIDLKYEGNRK